MLTKHETTPSGRRCPKIIHTASNDFRAKRATLAHEKANRHRELIRKESNHFPDLFSAIDCSKRQQCSSAKRRFCVKNISLPSERLTNEIKHDWASKYFFSQMRKRAAQDEPSQTVHQDFLTGIRTPRRYPRSRSGKTFLAPREVISSNTKRSAAG